MREARAGRLHLPPRSGSWSSACWLQGSGAQRSQMVRPPPPKPSVREGAASPRSTPGSEGEGWRSLCPWHCRLPPGWPRPALTCPGDASKPGGRDLHLGVSAGNSGKGLELEKQLLRPKPQSRYVRVCVCVDVCVCKEEVCTCWRRWRPEQRGSSDQHLTLGVRLRKVSAG